MTRMVNPFESYTPPTTELCDLLTREGCEDIFQHKLESFCLDVVQNLAKDQLYDRVVNHGEVAEHSVDFTSLNRHGLLPNPDEAMNRFNAGVFTAITMAIKNSGMTIKRSVALHVGGEYDADEDGNFTATFNVYATPFEL